MNDNDLPSFEWNTAFPPCMSMEESNLILQHLLKHRPRSVLEYGIGGSTVNFPRLSCIERWVGVDHKLEWIDRIRDHTKAELLLFPVEEPFWSGNKPSDQLVKYVEVGGIKEKFDFIFIDGIARMECVAHSVNLLNQNGFVMMHDTSRTNTLHACIRAYPKHSVLTHGELIPAAGVMHRGLTLMWK